MQRRNTITAVLFLAFLAVGVWLLAGAFLEGGSLRQELGELRRMRDQIPQVMLDARASAQALQDQMNAQAQVARDNLRQALDADLAQLARYREQIQALRQSLQEALEGMDRQAQQLQQQAQALEEESPEEDLQLFA